MNWNYLLSRNLPVLARLAGKEEVQYLAEKLNSISYSREHTEHEAIISLLKVFHQLHKDLIQIKQKFDENLELLTSVQTELARRGAIVEILLKTKKGNRLLEDINSLDRWFDEGAIYDRNILEIHQIRQRWEFMATAIAGMEIDLLTIEPLQQIYEISSYVAKDRLQPWSMRVSALQLLYTCACANDTLRPTIRQLFWDCIGNYKDDPWVQSKALESYLALREKANERVADILTFVVSPPSYIRARVPADYSFVRARAIELCAKYRQWRLIGQIFESNEKSEHVLITAVQVLGKSNSAHAREILQKVLFNPNTTYSNVVKTAGLVALIPDFETEIPEEHLLWIPLIGLALKKITDSWIIDILIQSILDSRSILKKHTLWIEHCFKEWGDDLCRLMKKEDKIPDLQACVATLYKWLLIQTKQNSKLALDEILTWISQAKEGQFRDFYEGSISNLTDDELLEVLIVAASEHFDLSAISLKKLHIFPSLAKKRL